MNTTSISYLCRDKSIDAAKGFAIIFVIFGHVLQEYFPTDHISIQLIQAFHMPLFMFISGYLSTKLKSADLLSRGKRLLIPYMTYILIYPLVTPLITSGDVPYDILVSYISMLIYPDLGLWFLWTLFFINCVFVLGQYFAKKTSVPEYLIITCISLIGFILIATDIAGEKFAIHQIFRYFLFFSFGYLVHTRFKNATSSTPILLVSITTFLILSPFCTVNNSACILYDTPLIGTYLPTILRLVTNLCGTIGFFMLFKHIWKAGTIHNLLVKLGNITLGIYFFHFFLIHFFTNIWHNTIFPSITQLNIAPIFQLSFNIIWIICTVLSIAILSHMIVSIIQKNKLASQLCLGATL